MCSGFEPLLMGAGEAGIADMVGLGAGDLIGSGAAELGMGAGASLGMGATDMSLGAAGAGNAASYLSQLGGLDSVLGSQFAGDIAPFTQSATDVASITNNAVPGLENNIGNLGNFEGIPPQAPEPLPGLSQASNMPTAPVAESTLSQLGTRSLPMSAAPGTQEALNNAVTTSMGSSAPINYSGVQDMMPGFNSGPAMPGAGGSAFSLENLMNNPMGAVKSAYDTVSNNPVASIYAGSSLYDMYAKKKMAEEQKALYNQNRADIMNTYTPGSPEYNQLYQQMARKDAAAGRNSQYGTRGNDLAATIAKLRMGAIGNLQSGQNTLANQAMSNQYGMFNTPLALTMYSQRRDPSRGTAY